VSEIFLVIEEISCCFSSKDESHQCRKLPAGRDHHTFWNGVRQTYMNFRAVRNTPPAAEAAVESRALFKTVSYGSKNHGLVAV
jgi:hypothetical protein